MGVLTQALCLRRGPRSGEKSCGREHPQNEDGDPDEVRPTEVMPDELWKVRVRGPRATDGPGRHMREGGVRSPEMPVVDREDLPWVQTQVSGVGAKEPPDVDVAEQSLESLSLQRLEVVRPDPGLPCGLLDGLSPKEAGFAESRTDPDPLHVPIVATGQDQDPLALGAGLLSVFFARRGPPGWTRRSRSVYGSGVTKRDRVFGPGSAK